MTMTTEQQTKIAETIRIQIGGNRFVAMTGANNFLSFQREGCAGLQFKLPRGAVNKSNLVTITLERGLIDGDTYTLRFLKYRNLEVKTISEHSYIEAADLRRVFREQTGLDTSL